MDSPQAAHSTSVPSPWVVRWSKGIVSGGLVADIACGSGRHTRHLLAAGHPVTAIDRDVSGLNDLRDDPNLTLLEQDLEAGQPFPLPTGTCAGIIVTNYLWRPLLDDIVDAVNPDGILIYETFAIGNERYGKPSNPDFLLRPGELIGAVAGRLTPIAYEHATDQSGEEKAQKRIRQRIAAVGPDHKWLIDPP